MNRRHFIKNILAGGTGLYMGAAPFSLLAKEGHKVVTIIHTNDLHCHIEPFSSSREDMDGKGGIARIAAYAKHVRAENPNTLLLDAGDMFQGTPYFNYFKGEVILKTMGQAGYDAGTIGNHEFDNGLEGILNALPHASFPLVSSNYDFKDTMLNGLFPRFKIFEKSGILIGVYGLGIELKGLVNENNYGNTIYNDPLKVALEMETFLKKEMNCHLVVCLSHLGHSYEGKIISDLVIGKETSHTNLVIGGHTHSYLKEPVQVKNKKGEMVLVNQAWWGGLMVGHIDFVFEAGSGRKSSIFANKLNG